MNIFTGMKEMFLAYPEPASLWLAAISTLLAKLRTYSNGKWDNEHPEWLAEVIEVPYPVRWSDWEALPQ